MSEYRAMLDDRGLIYAFQDSKTKMVTLVSPSVSCNYKASDKPFELLGKVRHRKPLMDEYILKNIKI